MESGEARHLSLVQTSMVEEKGQDGPPRGISETIRTHGLRPLPALRPGSRGGCELLSKGVASPLTLSGPLTGPPPNILSSFPSCSPVDNENCDNGEHVPSDRRLQVHVVEKRGPTPRVAKTFQRGLLVTAKSH